MKVTFPHSRRYGNPIPVETAAAELCSLLEEVRPDTVVTFGADGITGHPDHRAVAAWAALAFQRAAPRGARLLRAAIPAARAARWKALTDRFGVFEPGYPVVPDEVALDLRLSPEVSTLKVRALAAQATQTAGLIEAMGPDVYAAWVSEESFA
ncbi:PIG-L family deacetylase [Dactylosporangium sp. NPDC005572]|uniref:PIG-L family deacetylase n=1 Tax=Dactylosporangium sp. NPDC005572 TaxID=3156889 RepID=UPI0033AD473E